MNPESQGRQIDKKGYKKESLKLYKEKPINQININEIIDACRCSRSTFYYYYEDIYALYKECEQDAIKIVETGVSNVVLYSLGQNIDRYKENYTEFAKRMSHHADLINSLLSGSQNKNFRSIWLKSIKTNYIQTISFSKKHNETQKKLMMEFFAAGKLRLLSEWFENGCKEPPEEIAFVSAHALFKGLL